MNRAELFTVYLYEPGEGEADLGIEISVSQEALDALGQDKMNYFVLLAAKSIQDGFEKAVETDSTVLLD